MVLRIPIRCVELSFIGRYLTYLNILKQAAMRTVLDKYFSGISAWAEASALKLINR